MLLAAIDLNNSDLSWIIPCIALVLTALGQIFFSARSRRRAIAQLGQRTSQAALEERLENLSKSMRESARLVEQVEAELAARAATAQRLQEDAKTAEALAALHRNQAEAVRRMMDAELATTAKGIRSDSIKIGIASFVAGGGLTLLVTLLVHPLH